MASKYFDRDGRRIDSKRYRELMKDKRYAIIDEIVYGKNVKLRIEWQGKFHSSIPNEYCMIYQVRVMIFVESLDGEDKWVYEPIGSGDTFRYIGSARDRMDQLAKQFDLKYGTGTSNTVVEDSMDDYGEPEIIKDIPKTKSAKLGAW